MSQQQHPEDDATVRNAAEILRENGFEDLADRFERAAEAGND